MRLKKILHPELVLDKRGPEDVRRMFKLMMDKIIWRKEPRTTDIPSDFGNSQPMWELTGGAEVLEHDPNGRDHWLLMKKFQVERPKIYHIGKDFLNALVRVNKDIPADLLPERFFGYISFADEAVYDEDGYVDGAYVFIGDAKEIFHNHAGRKVLWIAYHQNPIDGQHEAPACRLYIWLNDQTVKNIKEGDPFKDLENAEFDSIAVNRADTHSNAAGKADSVKFIRPSKDEIAARSSIFNLILNSVLYIHSQEPDVSHLHPAHGSIRQRKKHYKETGKENMCSVPVVAVSWGYERPRSYGKDSGWWGAFPRWQRCGPGLKHHKLIWVKAHQKKFKKEKDDEEEMG
jgi:hypothetical protein